MVTVFAIKSVDFVSHKGIETKKSLPPAKVFFFVKFTIVIFLAVSPQRGPASIITLHAFREASTKKTDTSNNKQIKMILETAEIKLKPVGNGRGRKVGVYSYANICASSENPANKCKKSTLKAAHFKDHLNR